MSRTLFLRRMARIALLPLSLCAIALAQSGASIQTTTYPIAYPQTVPISGITAGPDGKLWFATERYHVGSITTNGAIAMYLVPSDLVDGSEPYGIVAGPDGALWFTEYSGNNIGRITTAGQLTQYPLPTAQSHPTWIAAGNDGALWFAEISANNIGRITTAGAITEFPVPTPNSGPNGITAGPDGAIWFTEESVNKIGRVTVDGAFTEFPVPVDTPNTIVTGSDGALWFTALYNIGRITTAGAFTRYGTVVGAAYAIAAGPDGALWFTGLGPELGRITTHGVITLYPVPVSLFAVAPGPNGALWFTDLDNGITTTPACGFGFRADFAGSTLTMHFDLGTSVPANFSIHLRDAGGPFGVPFSKAIPAVDPSQPFTMTWTPFPQKGKVTVVPQLTDGAGQELCAQWATVDTTGIY